MRFLSESFATTRQKRKRSDGPPTTTSRVRLRRSKRNRKNSCRVCLALSTVFLEPGARIDLGLLDEILQQQSCAAHDPLLRWVRKAFDEEQEQRKKQAAELMVVGGGPHNLVLLAADGAGQARIKVSCSPGQLRPGLYWDLLLVRPGDETSGSGRELDSNWVDLQLARRWVRTCAQRHGARCQNPLSVRRVSPALLINVVDECLVPGRIDLEYVTLSYRWGSCTGFQTNVAILNEFSKPGGLSSSVHADKVPPIIRHAMELVRALGEHYLWADAVCLIQGDDERMARELQMMGAIYASAKMTIVPTDGDALDGISGLKGISQSRNFSQQTFPWTDGDNVVIRQQPVLKNEPGCSPYFERGWTFQEFLFSKRRLIFAEKQIHWKCACANWHEDLIEAAEEGTGEDEGEGGDETSEISPPESSLGAWEPDCGRLGLMLGEYNSRKLTFPEDALPGVTGLLALLSRSFQGGFLFGLPEMCFDAALLWDSFEARQKITRRMPSGDYNRHSVLPQSQLPSWSWVGWQFQRLRMADEESMGAFTMLPRNVTTPITQWYSHETSGSTTKRAIRPAWFEFREKLMKNSESSTPPKGWEKEQYNPNKHGQVSERQPHFLGDHVYWHTMLPEKYYWCPLPLALIDEDVRPCMPVQHPYISCETKRGWFRAAWASRADIAAAESRWQVRIYDRVRLVNGSGVLCGWLQLLLDGEGREDGSASFPDAKAAVTMGGGLEVELAAVCLQHWPTPKPWKDEDEAGRDAHAFYGVLWVEWIDGVAYRKGSGFVSKSMWETHNLTDVHLVLG